MQVGLVLGWDIYTNGRGDLQLVKASFFLTGTECIHAHMFRI